MPMGSSPHIWWLRVRLDVDADLHYTNAVSYLGKKIVAQIILGTSLSINPTANVAFKIRYHSYKISNWGLIYKDSAEGDVFRCVCVSYRFLPSFAGFFPHSLLLRSP